MEFYSLDKKHIKKKSVLVCDSYVYTIGNKVEVVSTKRKNMNTVLSNCLSSDKKEDKFMVRYYPSNIIYFDKELIDSDDDSISVSCFIDRNNYSVHIGKEGKYEINSGVLAFSGVLSANNLIESERYFFSNSQMSQKATLNKVRIISVGVVGESLYGLCFLPKERGLAISSDESSLAFSVKTWNLNDFSDWSRYTLTDWFINSKVKEL